MIGGASGSQTTAPLAGSRMTVDPQVEAAAAVQAQIPGSGAFALDDLDRLEPEVGQPRGDLVRRSVGPDPPWRGPSRPGPAGPAMGWRRARRVLAGAAEPGRSSASGHPVALAGLPAATPACRPSGGDRHVLLDSDVGVPTSVVRRARDAAGSSPRTRRSGSGSRSVRTSGSIRTLRPMRTPRGMTACLPTIVIPVLRWLGVRRFATSKSVPSPTIAPGPTVTSLSRIARSTTAPGRIDRVEHDDRVADDGPDADHHARRQDGVDDHALDQAAVARSGCGGPGRWPRSWPGRAPRTGCGSATRGRRGRGRAGPRAAPGSPPSRTGSCPRPASSRRSGSRRRGPRPDHVRDHVAAEVGARLGQPAMERPLAEDVDAHARRGRTSAASASP